jgi:hypothetical protein
VPAASGIIARPRIKDVASLAFAGASVARSAVALSAAECVNNKMPVPAAAATRTDARQRRKINRCRGPPGRLELRCQARAIGGGSDWFVVASRPRGVLRRIPNAIVQSKRWAARSIVLAGANPSLAFRCGGVAGILDPCSSGASGEGFAFCIRSSVRYLPGADRSALLRLLETLVPPAPWAGGEIFSVQNG